jgi:hypothetical protein
MNRDEGDETTPASPPRRCFLGAVHPMVWHVESCRGPCGRRGWRVHERGACLANPCIPVSLAFQSRLRLGTASVQSRRHGSVRNTTPRYHATIQTTLGRGHGHAFSCSGPAEGHEPQVRDAEERSRLQLDGLGDPFRGGPLHYSSLRGTNKARCTRSRSPWSCTSFQASTMA